MKKILLIMFCPFLFLVGCQESHNKIVLSEVTRSIFYAPQYIAIEKEFFKEEGLDVELQTAWGGDKVMTALLSDHADIGLVGSKTSIYVHHENPTDPIINFAQLTETDGTFLVSKKDDDHFNWNDLHGEKFLGQRKSVMPQMVGEYVLKKHDIQPHDDLNLIQNINFANIPSAFLSMDTQYVQLFEPTASLFEAEGNGKIVASFGEEAGDLPYTVFMTKESTIDDNENMVTQFTRAIYRAQQWIYETDNMTIAETIQPYFDDVSIDIIAQSVERYKEQESFATSPLLQESAWDNLLNVMDEAGELRGDAPYDLLVNRQIAEKVMKEEDN